MSTSSTIGIRLALEGADKTEAGLRRVAGSMGSLESAATSVRSAVGGLAGVLAGSISVAGFVKAADAVTTLQNQLKLATGSAQAAGKAYEQLFEIAQRSRVSFTELGGTFASISRASESLGLSQRDLLSLTETIGNAITVSGASAQASNAALVQLSQGLASGVLRGEELNSIMEQTPRLAQAIADGLNVPIAKLREMGQAGQLTSDQVINALRSQAAVLANEVQSSVLTVSQAYTQLESSVVKAVGELDEATGTSKTLAQAISALAVTVKDAGKAISENREVILGTVGALASAAAAAGLLKVAGSIGAITVAFKALGVAMAANPAGLAFLGISAGVGGFMAYNAGLKDTREGLAAAIRDLEDTNKSVENSIYGKPSASAMRQVEERKRQIREMRQALAAMDSAGLDTRAEDSRFARQNQTIGAAATGRANAQTQWDKEALKYLTDRQKMEREIAQAREVGLKAGKSELEIEARVKQIRDSYAKKGGSGKAAQVSDDQRALASYVESLEKMLVKEQELTEVQKAQGMLKSLGVLGQNEQVRELVLSLAGQVDAERALEDSLKRQAEAAKEAAEAEKSRVDALERSAQSVQDQVQKLLDEEKALQIAAAGNISLAQAVEEVNIARLTEQQIKRQAEGASAAELQAIQKEIDARKQLKDAIGRLQVRDAAKDQAEEAAREWKRAAQSIEQTLTDALMRGFESGKGFGENLADSLVNIFKTYVAREISKAITQAIMSSIASTQWGQILSGFMGGGNTGGIAGNLMGGASNASSLYSAGNTLMTGGGSNYGAAASWATGGMSTANLAGSIYANAATSGMATGSIAASGAGIDALLATNAAYGTAASGAAAAGGAAAGGATTGAAAGASSALAAIPVWGWVAIAAIALWQPLFGRKLKEAGMQATLNSGQITTQEYQYFKGGLFRSDKTKVKDVDTPETRAFAQEVKNVQDSTAAMVRALGLSSASIENYSGKVRVNMKGVDNAAEAQQRMSEAMDKFRQQLAATVPGLDMSKKEFQKFVEGIQQSIQQAGISTEGLSEIIVQGMLGKMNASQVGEALSDMVIGGIYNSIASQYAGQIASVFTSQIITPIFTALAAGVPISQAISQQAIDQVVQTAKEAAAQLNAVFSDPGFRSAIAGVQEAISGISGAATSVRAPAYKAAASNYNAAADAAKRAAEETRRAWQSIADSITEEIRRIRGELLGDTTAGQSYYMAQFEDATRRARAGDQQAANRLPELSQAVLDIARATAGSLGELQFIQTSTIASLNQTRKIISQRFGLTIPAFADGGLHSGGLRLVGERGPELEVTGPARYFDARQTQKLMAGDPELRAEVRALAESMQRLADSNSQIETNTRRTQQILDTVSQGGDSFVTVAA